eukprot:scaffold15950_cov21-Tisochrysis_lutea.AAC.1
MPHKCALILLLAGGRSPPLSQSDNLYAFKSFRCAGAAENYQHPLLAQCNVGAHILLLYPTTLYINLMCSAADDDEHPSLLKPVTLHVFYYDADIHWAGAADEDEHPSPHDSVAYLLQRLRTSTGQASLMTMSTPLLHKSTTVHVS